jgi:hypothetical protein
MLQLNQQTAMNTTIATKALVGMHITDEDKHQALLMHCDSNK